jgi:prophage antirepressor-like protein
MENEVRHVANLKFLKLSFHVYEYDGRRWIPLVDIANGLGYKRPQKLYDLANRYKKRLHEKGRIIDLDSAPQRGLIVPNLGTINLAQKTNRATLLINYEGLVFLSG